MRVGAGVLARLSRVVGRRGGEGLRGQLIRGASGTFALKIFDALLVLITTLLLARLLGVRQYGIYAYAGSWVTLLSMPAVLGLPRMLVREIAKYKTQGDWAKLRALIRWSDRVVVRLSVAIAAVAAAVVLLLRELGVDSSFAVPLWLALPMLPPFALMRLRQGATQGLGAVAASQVPQMVIMPVIALGVVLILGLAFRIGASVAVGIRTMAVMVAFLGGATLQRRLLLSGPEEPSKLPPERSWLRSGFNFFLIDVGGVANEQLSLVVLGTVAGPEAAGVFDVARRAALILRLIFQAVDMPLAPAVARLHATGETLRIARVARKSARLSFYISLPVAAIMIAFAPQILSLFGSGFAGGRLPLVILVIGQLFNVYMGPVAIVLSMTGREKETARGVGIAAVINVLLSAVLAPKLGPEGAALANASSLITWNVLLWRSVRGALGINVTAF